MQYLINDCIKITIDPTLIELVSFFDKALYYYKCDRLRITNNVNDHIHLMKLNKNNEYLKFVDAESVFDGKKFFIIDSRSKLIEVPFNQFSNKEIEMEVEEGCNPASVYYYVIESLVRYKLLTNHNTMMLHASAVEFNNINIAFPAWGGTGKTNLVLTLLDCGAKFFSDDLVFINDKGEMIPYIKPLNLFNYNIKYFPRLGSSRGIKKKLLELVINSFHLIYKFLSLFLRSDGIVVNALKVILRYSKDVTNTKMSIAEAFGETAIASSGELDYLFQIVRTTTEEPKVSMLLLDNLINTLEGCHKEEWARFTKYQNMYAYLSGLPCYIDDVILNKEKEVLQRALDHKPVFLLEIPNKGMSKDCAVECIGLINQIVK